MLLFLMVEAKTHRQPFVQGFVGVIVDIFNGIHQKIYARVFQHPSPAQYLIKSMAVIGY